MSKNSVEKNGHSVQQLHIQEAIMFEIRACSLILHFSTKDLRYDVLDDVLENLFQTSTIDQGVSKLACNSILASKIMSKIMPTPASRQLNIRVLFWYHKISVPKNLKPESVFYVLIRKIN